MIGMLGDSNPETAHEMVDVCSGVTSLIPKKHITNEQGNEEEISETVLVCTTRNSALSAHNMNKKNILIILFLG